MTRAGGGLARRSLPWAVAICAAVLSVGGCADIEESGEAGHAPAAAEEVEGSDVKRVTFEADAAEQVSLRTAVVKQSGEYTTVPYAALIYDPEGQVWVYASPEPLSYQRVPVLVDRVIGQTVWLSEGPAAGTRVVTVGAAEVLGVELDIAGGH